MLRNLFRMATEAPAKKLKVSPPLIGTHNGTFHADEALAVYLLRLLPTYAHSPLLRTRDPAQLATCHTVVDVGGEYSPATNRYDHHQRTFDTTFPGHATKLSSAGLVYLHFGRAIVAAHAGLAETDPRVALLHEKLYTDFVEAIDANDNGVHAHDPSTTPKPRFKAFGTTLPSLVADLNHPLDLPPPPTGVPTQVTDRAVLAAPAEKLAPEQLPQAAEDARFLQASTLMGTAFVRKLALAWAKWLPARDIVREAYDARRRDVDPSGRIMELKGGGVPWKEHLYNIEEEEEEEMEKEKEQAAKATAAGAAREGEGEVADKGGEGGEQKEPAARVLFVLYPEGPEENSRWRVQAVSKSLDSFENRLGLREEWRGVRDQDLAEKSGIKGCVFVHAAGFIGGNETREGALEMARKSLVN